MSVEYSAEAVLPEPSRRRLGHPVTIPSVIGVPPSSVRVSFGFRPPLQQSLLGRTALLQLGSADPIEYRKAAGQHVEQAFTVGGGLPILAHWNVRSVLPQLHLNLGADPPLLIQTGGVQPGRAQGFECARSSASHPRPRARLRVSQDCQKD